MEKKFCIDITDEIYQALFDTINNEFGGSQVKFSNKANVNRAVITRYKNKSSKKISFHTWDYIYPLIKHRLPPSFQEQLKPMEEKYFVKYKSLLQTLDKLPKDLRERLIAEFNEIALNSLKK